MPSRGGLSTTTLHPHCQLLSISSHTPSTPLVSQLRSHASAIRACRTLQTPTLLPWLGALLPYAAIDLLAQISRGSMACPSDAPSPGPPSHR